MEDGHRMGKQQQQKKELKFIAKDTSVMTSAESGMSAGFSLSESCLSISWLRLPWFQVAENGQWCLDLQV